MAITVKHKFVSAIPDGTDATIVRPSNWNDDHDFTGTLPVANGGTGVTSSSGANSVVLRDANGNITTNCLFEGFSSQAASVTTIVLTASSVQNWQITGSGGQTIKLPNATTLPNGALFTFNNNQSSGTIIVQNNSSTTVATINSGGYVTVILLDNSIAAGSWDRHDLTPSNVSWSTNTLDYAGSITSATWNGNAVAYNRGGTGQSSAFTAGGVVYGSTTSALAVTPIGTTGQVLTSAGAGTPTWTTPTTGTVTSVTGTSPVVSSGGATPAISMPAATSSVNGYLTSADWTTFNGKQVALVSGTNIKTVNGTTLLGSGDLGIITGTYGGTGVNNGANTLTMAGSVTHAGAFTQSFTATANTAVTLPTTGTLATLAGTETFTNKTLTNPTITNYTETLYAPAAGSAFTVDLTNGTVQKFTTNANTTVTLPTSVTGKSFVIMIAYGGAHSITWAGGSTIKWAGGVTPTATAVNAKFDIFTFFCDGTNTYGSVLGQNY
jgi:hypothetical protein